MAQYKVIQDIEAEDKLLGPLTLKQFIYFSITAVCLYLMFFAATRGAAFLGVILLPPAAFFGVLGFPWSKTQPTEVWLLAKIRFFFKPRKRIWDQSGTKELVTITVPKKVEKYLTDGLDQSQVRSRLTALAQTVDSRGWAVKQLGSAPFGGVAADDSDRLTAGTETPQTLVVSDVGVEEDVLDERNNPTAQQIDKMINQSTVAHKAQLQQRMTQPAPATQSQPEAEQTPQDFWFMSQNDPSEVPSGMATGQGTTVAPHAESTPQTANTSQLSKEEEEALLDKIHSSQARKPSRTYHQKTIVPLSEQKMQKKQESPPSQAPQTAQIPEPTTKTPDPVVTQLADNNDLNIETIARQANKAKEDDHPDEVVISLH